MLPHSRLSKISTSPTHSLETSIIQQNIIQSKHLNSKLQQLFHSLKSNTHIKNLSHSASSSPLSNKHKLQNKKTLEKLQMQVQHMKHLENLLLSQTKKLKEQVNNRRKQRVIYSNIFKKYEKDIKKWQCQYKESLLDNMATNDAHNSLKEKMNKIKRRLEKEIKELEMIKKDKERQQKMGLQNEKSNHIISRYSTKNITNNESYKKLMTQKQIQLKAKSLQSQFEKESRKIMFEALSEQVLKIAGTDNLHEAIHLIKNIDKKTEQIYREYELLEKKNKQKESKCNEIQQKIRQKKGTQTSISTQKEIHQILTISQQIENQERRIRQLQEELSVKLDLNCRKLPTDQLMSFIDRMMLTRNKEVIEELILQNQSSRREKSARTDPLISGREGQKAQKKPRNVLEKKLQNVEKEKQINNYLLTYSEINQFMLEQISRK